ncbi:hypothetical protein K1719_008531 [Acacia pycnantha]|nr:hypothetical protein K1719_008531 [Acacia pycnantha]
MDVEMGVGRLVKDGKSTNFWWDLWTPLEEPLIQFVEKNWQLIDPGAKVSSFVQPNGTWNTQALEQFLPRWVINIVAGMKIPESRENDPFCWRNASEGRFSVRAVYHMIVNSSNDAIAGQWQRMRKEMDYGVPEEARCLTTDLSRRDGFVDRLWTNPSTQTGDPSNQEYDTLGMGSRDQICTPQYIAMCRFAC